MEGPDTRPRGYVKLMRVNKSELRKTEMSKQKAGEVALVQTRGPSFISRTCVKLVPKFLSSHPGAEGGGEERLPVVTG